MNGSKKSTGESDIPRDRENEKTGRCLKRSEQLSKERKRSHSVEETEKSQTPSQRREENVLGRQGRTNVSASKGENKEKRHGRGLEPLCYTSKSRRGILKKSSKKWDSLQKNR